MKIRTIIIEDEKPALLGLTKSLGNFEEIEVIDHAMDGIAALEKMMLDEMELRRGVVPVFKSVPALATTVTPSSRT